jgi:hypothetical protein
MEHLPSKYEAPSSNPSTAPSKKENFSIILNKNGESGHLVSFLILGEKVSVFSQEYSWLVRSKAGYI